MQLSPRLPWRFLLATLVLVPLAVGVVPLSGTHVTLNVFVQAKLIALCLLLALSLGSWALISLREGPLVLGRALIPLGVFLVVAAVSAGTALSPRIAVFGDFEQGVGLLVFALCGLAAFLVTQQVRGTASLSELTTVVILTAVGVASIGLLQQIPGIDVLGIASNQLPIWILQRGYGTIGNADTYAAYLVLPALLAVHRFRGAETKRDRTLWGGAVIALLTSCVIAQTRAPLVGLAVGGAAYGLSELRRARRESPGKARHKQANKGGPTSSGTILIMVAATVVVGVAAIILLSTATNFGERFGTLESLRSLGGRIPLWTSALEIATKHPPLGVGPDSFRLGWYATRDVAHLAGGAGLVITDPHSLPLLLAATMGVMGLLSAAYLLVSAIMAGFATLSKTDAERHRPSDYAAWLYGTITLSVTLLATLLTSVILMMLCVALGVLIAPSLRPVRNASGSAITLLRTLSLPISAGLLVLGLLAASAHLIAVGAQTDDAALAAERASRAAALAPWDSGLRNLRDETMVQATFERVFAGQLDAASSVERSAETLSAAARAEPYDYLHPYRAALLLIGAGQILGTEYTSRGVEAGLDALTLYPTSVELRTGVGSGLLQLGEPDKTAVLLVDYWDADPNYLSAGLTYAEALLAQGAVDTARGVVTTLLERFPDSDAVADLNQRLQAN